MVHTNTLFFKDPNAPKRPLTAFFLYAADHRAKVREELGEGCTVGDISKKIGKQWAEIDDDEKQKYQDQAAKNKAQYEKELEAYHAGMFFCSSPLRTFTSLIAWKSITIFFSRCKTIQSKWKRWLR